jgi:selenocysteine-specific elongation factor
MSDDESPPQPPPDVHTAISGSSNCNCIPTTPTTSIPTTGTNSDRSLLMSQVEPILNINVGVLGHVDSGKTSLVKALSTLLSTAALDKSTQSRQRGMTLDLGFSCFFIDLPHHIREKLPNDQLHQQVQITLVDCPGHASLIRTIIGGAQIIDLVLLVVDAVKGWQAQTTECLVLAELCSPHLVVALNKIDAFPENERDQKVEEARSHVRERLQRTRFASLRTPMIGVSACVGGEKVAAIIEMGNHNKDIHNENNISLQNSQNCSINKKHDTINIDQLIMTLKEELPVPQRIQSGAFYFAIDHCFPIRGRGTVITGTCLSGSLAVNDVIEFPTLALDRKVKSMQMFKRQVRSISQGDRAGICVSNFDATLLERGIAAAPGAVQLWKGAIAIVRKVQYYPGKLLGNSKFHISVGHTTVMATVNFWGARELDTTPAGKHLGICWTGDTKKGMSKALDFASFGGSADMARLPRIPFDFNQDFVHQDDLLESLEESNTGSEPLLHWALLDFQTPVYCPIHCLVIGSRLDTVDNASKSSSSCRLSFSGRLMERVDMEKDPQRIRLYTPKEKRAVISKLGDPHKRADDDRTVRYEVFGSDLFKKETNMKLFIGMRILTSTGDIGEIKSSFGTTGNFRVHFPAGTEAKEGDPLILRFKRFSHDATKSMHQDLELPAARSGSRIEIIKTKAKKNVPGVNKVGMIDSVKGDTLENGKQNMAVVSGFFAPEINIKDKVGTTVIIPGTGEQGTIVGPFGKAGKCKVLFDQGISAKVGEKAELRI